MIINYIPNIVSEERVFNHQHAEIEAGMTLIGPHRDDFEIFLNDHNLKVFGSRGEQRLGLLTISLGSLDYLEFLLKERPILLLDDIFSELDSVHRCNVLNLLNNQQTIITTTNWERVRDKNISDFSLIELK